MKRFSSEMKTFPKLIILLVTAIEVVRAQRDTTTQQLDDLLTQQQEEQQQRTAHISPEIINELKDFKNLIPRSTVDEIVAKHYLTDKNFRTALKYFRSENFKQLQKQLLSIPEIVNILEFLHLTTEHATTTHDDDATTLPTNGCIKTLWSAGSDDLTAVADNRNDKVTTNIGTLMSKLSTAISAKAKEATSKKNQQQFASDGEYGKIIEVDNGAANAYNTFAGLSNDPEETPVHVVLLEDLKPRIHNRPHNIYRQYTKFSQHNNHYGESLGTLTTVVEEILQHLSHAAFQTMIKGKCQKNMKFAEFYGALRSDEFKAVIKQAKSTANIMQLMKTLASHDVDVNSLELVAFKIISWGPDI